MRIISGTDRGRKLISLEESKVRPTTDKVKESLFNILQFKIEGRVFLDLFAGSGQVGLEALSRGAKDVFLVDAYRKSAAVIEKNIQVMTNKASAHLFCEKAQSFLAGTTQKFDVAFLDPPYIEENTLISTLEAVVPKMSETGIVVCEHPAEEVLPDRVGDYVKKKSYRYGKIMLTTFEHYNYLS